MLKEDMRGAIIPEDWELVESWLTSTVQYIISINDSQDLVKRWEYSEEFIERIEFFRFQEYS